MLKRLLSITLCWAIAVAITAPFTTAEAWNEGGCDFDNDGVCGFVCTNPSCTILEPIEGCIIPEYTDEEPSCE